MGLGCLYYIVMMHCKWTATKAPTVSPTEAPSASPTTAPSASPSEAPTESPTAAVAGGRQDGAVVVEVRIIFGLMLNYT